MKNNSISASCKRGLCILLIFLLLLSLFPAATAASPEPRATVIATGTVGSGGAAWRLYSDGTLRVEGGFLHWDGASHGFRSPWYARNTQISRIIFTAPVTAGTSLSGLFSSLSRLTAIEGLAHLDTRNVVDMGWMFNETNLQSLDLSGLDTRNVRYMDGMFAFAAIQSINLSGFDTRSAVNMDWMFRSALNLRRLDLTGFDTRNVQFMGQMLAGTSSLREITFGETFRFIVDEEGSRHAALPNVPQNNTYTGRWQNLGPGTPQNPQGPLSFTSAQLQAQFNAATMAGTFVWQPTNHPPPGIPFVDVNFNHWALDAIRFVYANNMMQGTGANTFTPYELAGGHATMETSFGRNRSANVRPSGVVVGYGRTRGGMFADVNFSCGVVSVVVRRCE